MPVNRSKTKLERRRRHSSILHRHFVNMYEKTHCCVNRAQNQVLRSLSLYSMLEQCIRNCMVRCCEEHPSFGSRKTFSPPLTRSALSFASRIQFDRFYYFNESRIRVTPKSIFIYNEFLLRE